ncbi:DUF2567 domain-containing protein [Streptomyces acidiscabies]|uniref:DUF2567 domain-containing protein n=1 Tax=Streptomyces acidiscabies TaxID=42234 RepID=A0AAP6B5R1_9ACTN|nr:DUF2567 domain-containing protein [Streptomyces acidiscabies]MBP5940229.1 DUF2567 domain-containing protein [Streptomyces sp. LBUM 1476]MBZ3911454.1 DUF2567 domain-containing protein [Streptomyces acidiscabies]MDX2958678.1 DUF2567 domain-containing protein [Streptomyces acidiscabies]MDX3018116.1 DUF2567 domain-containing protein [Streptomyces acidiscabies]MDX3791513.1 DUF2567 domain-containing protein [Streptomyces acidiscabies]
MTAPLTPPTPPHEPSPRGDWPPPPPEGYGEVVGVKDRAELLADLRDGALVAVGVTVLGVVLGLLWLWLAPRVPLVGDQSDGSWVVYLKDSEGEQAIGVDGTFTLLALACGALSAVGVFLWRRRGGIPLVVGLTVGGVLASVVAWKLGTWLGPSSDVIAHAKSAGKGVTFSAPLKLGAEGALMVWSIGGLLVHLGLTALFGPRDPEVYEYPYLSPPV